MEDYIAAIFLALMFVKVLDWLDDPAEREERRRKELVSKFAAKYLNPRTEGDV